MSIVNGNQINAPIGISDVSKVLGTASTDLGTLCTHQNVHKWAKYKPTNFVVDTDTVHSEKYISVSKGGDPIAAATNNTSTYVKQPVYNAATWKGDRRELHEAGADGDEGAGTRTVTSYVQENGFIIPCADEDAEPKKDTSYKQDMWRLSGEQQKWWRTRQWEYIRPRVYRLTDFNNYTHAGPSNDDSILHVELPETVVMSATQEYVIFELTNSSALSWAINTLSIDDFDNFIGGYFCVGFISDNNTVFEFRSDVIEKGNGTLIGLTSVKVPRVFFEDKYKLNGYGTGLDIDTLFYIRKGSRLFSLCTGKNEPYALRTVHYRYRNQVIYVRYEVGIIPNRNGYIGAGGSERDVYVEDYKSSIKSSKWSYSAPSFYFKCVVEKDDSISADDLHDIHAKLQLRVTIQNTNRWGHNVILVPKIVMPKNAISIPLYNIDVLSPRPAVGQNTWGYQCCCGMVISSSDGYGDSLHTGYYDSRNDSLINHLGNDYWEGEPSGIPIVSQGVDLTGKSYQTNVAFGIDGYVTSDNGIEESIFVEPRAMCGDGREELGSDNNYYVGMSFTASGGTMTLHTTPTGGSFPTGDVLTALFPSNFNKDTWLPKPSDSDWNENYRGEPIPL